MARRLLYALALVFASLALGLTVSHVLEIPGKRQLTGEVWLQVQQTLYGGFAIVGAIAEIGGALACIALEAIERRRGRGLWPAIAAAAFGGMLGVYWFGNRQLNAQVAAWTPETIPADWTVVRERWDTAHTLSAGLAALASGSLLAAVLTQLPDDADQPPRDDSDITT